jgi:hypothetical protein
MYIMSSNQVDMDIGRALALLLHDGPGWRGQRAAIPQPAWLGAGAATAAVVMLGGSPASAAYAVTPHADGTVTVTG